MSTTTGTEFNIAVRRARALAAAVMFALGAFAAPIGAAPSDSVTTGSPFIRATPNPVPAGPGLGTVAISWDAAGASESAEVWVQVGDGEESLFGRSAVGSKAAPWIGNQRYVFRLFQGTDHKIELASTTVTRDEGAAATPEGAITPAAAGAAGAAGTTPASGGTSAGVAALGYYLLGMATMGLVWFARSRSARAGAGSPSPPSGTLQGG